MRTSQQTTDHWLTYGDELCYPQLCITFPISSGKHSNTENCVSELLSKHFETNLDCFSTGEQLFRYFITGLLLNKLSWAECGYEIKYHNCFATVARHFWICWASVQIMLSNNVSWSGLGLWVKSRLILIYLYKNISV